MEIQHNVPLAPFTTFGIGGPADYFIVTKSVDEIIETVNFAKDKGLDFFILGTGANILVGDKGFRGLVIKNEANKWKINNEWVARKKNIERQDPKSNAVSLTVESGATIEDLIKVTQEKGLSGFEHFAGIPSSVGGALWQNLHFLSPDRTETVFIGEIVEEASILRINDQGSMIKEVVDNSYFNFSYDYSVLHDNRDIVLSATFRLTVEDPKIIQERINANIKWRKDKHPENAVNTSAGSVFKKIEGYGAGRLIERVGLKGHQIGGAKISEKHANFIVNTGNAKASDVRELIDLVEKTVKKDLGLDLQPEISFVGEF